MKTVLVFTALLCIVHGTSQPKFVIDLFDRLDKNSDGELTQDEFNTVFLGIDSTGNSDRKVDEQEMVNAWVDFFQLGGAAEAKLLFSRMDMDQNGSITEDDVLGLFELFDFDESSQVDLSEFLDVWQKLTQP